MSLCFLNLNVCLGELSLGLSSVHFLFMVGDLRLKGLGDFVLGGLWVYLEVLLFPLLARLALIYFAELGKAWNMRKSWGRASIL